MIGFYSRPHDFRYRIQPTTPHFTKHLGYPLLHWGVMVQNILVIVGEGVRFRNADRLVGCSYQ